MLGAIIGDIIGSVYEWHNVKTQDFPLFTRESRFTDDSVMTVATAEAILNSRAEKMPFPRSYGYAKLYAGQYKIYGHRYPDCGYGAMFQAWCALPELTVNRSFGNGAAMRVSPIGMAFGTLDEVVNQAKYTTMYTHRHSESVKGACAVAAAVFLAKSGNTKDEIKEFIEKTFGYTLGTPLSMIRPHYRFDSSCRGSVPQAIRAFLESEDYLDAITKAISIGGDSDTIAAITGGISEAYYKEIPEKIKNRAMLLLDSGLKRTIREFYEKFKLSL